MDFQEVRQIMNSNREDIENLFKQVENQKARYKVFSQEYFQKKKIWYNNKHIKWINKYPNYS